MSIGNREVTLLIVLGVLLYAFLLYLILQNLIPDFKEVNSKTAEAQQKKICKGRT
jgi:competence protein ComGC